MTARISRRNVLASALTAPWLVRQSVSAVAEEPQPAAPRMDIHVHLFGNGDNSSGCRLSRAVTESPTLQFLERLLRLRERAKTLDEGYVLALAEQLQQSGLQKGLILAQDAVYDRNGKPDWTKTPFYVPNDYLFQVVARYPEWMVPCVSINPDRADAIAELERCVQKGARVLKIHPPIQGVDLADKKHTKFFQRCAALKTVVMVHTGHEHSSPIVDAGLANPRKLELALDQGCTVVACHCGTGRPDDRTDMLPDFLAVARKHKNLWGDTSVLGGFGRSRDFLRLLADKPIHDRLLHGSDFPFPAVPMAFATTTRRPRTRFSCDSPPMARPGRSGRCLLARTAKRSRASATGSTPWRSTRQETSMPGTSTANASRNSSVPRCCLESTDWVALRFRKKGAQRGSS